MLWGVLAVLQPGIAFLLGLPPEQDEAAQGAIVVTEGSAESVPGRVAVPLPRTIDGWREQTQRCRRCLHRHRREWIGHWRRLSGQGLGQGAYALIDRREVGQQLPIHLDAIAQGLDAALRSLQVRIHLDASPALKARGLRQFHVRPQACLLYTSPSPRD